MLCFSVWLWIKIITKKDMNTCLTNSQSSFKTINHSNILQTQHKMIDVNCCSSHTNWPLSVNFFYFLLWARSAKGRAFEVIHPRIALLSETAFWALLLLYLYISIKFLKLRFLAEASVFDLRNRSRNPKRIGILIYHHNKLQYGFIKGMLFVKAIFPFSLTGSSSVISQQKNKRPLILTAVTLSWQFT